MPIYTKSTQHQVIVGILLGIGVLQTLTRYIRIQFGGADWEPNFANVWRPLAAELYSGKSLYLEGIADNKPPLFELLNFALGALPNHGLVFLLATGLANGVVALLLWRLLTKQYDNWYGLIAVGMWFLTLPYVNGTHINVRSFALVGLLLSLHVRGPIYRGISISIAGLFSQYAVLFIPVLAWDSIRNMGYTNRMKWLFSFGASGIAALFTAFAVVGVIFGFRASLAGLYWSYGIPTGVAMSGFATAPESYLTEPWISTNILQWGGFILHYVGLLLPIILLSLLQIRRLVIERIWNVYMWGGVVMLLPLLVRSYAAYWVLALPFLISLGTVELRTRLSN